MKAPGRVKKVLINLLVLVVSLGGALLAAELVLHLAVGPDAPKNPTQFFEYNSLLGWSKIPNKAGWYIGPEYTVHKKMNSKGLRGLSALMRSRTMSSGYYVWEIRTVKAFRWNFQTFSLRGSRMR